MQFEITLLLLVGIFLCLISVMVLVIYIVDRVRVVASGIQQTPDIAQTTDASFHEMNGQVLWDALTGDPAVQDAELAARLAQIRGPYADVLRRHIEEIFEEGLLDGRQGVRLSPPPLRSVKTTGGHVNSWLPMQESNEIYSIGIAKGGADPGELTVLRNRLEDVVTQLFVRTGCNVPEGLAATLIPAANPLLTASAGNSELNKPVEAVAVPAAAGIAMPSLEPNNT